MRAPASGGVLALDLSLSTGWCYGEIGSEEPISGTWLLRERGDANVPPIEELGECYLALDNELYDAITVHRPALVIMEAPLYSKEQTTHRLLLGLAAHVESCCARREVQCREEFVQTARLKVLGRGSFPKGEAKQHVMAWCRARGWQFGTDDAADAMLLWYYMQGLLLQVRMHRAA